MRNLLAGGTEGNERLTTLTGLLLIVLLAGLGITILDLGGLLWLHLFLGLALIGPVALKMASTGYRFLRYYTHNRRYRIKGPPAPALRLLAPVVVATTVLVFLSGVVLLFIGPDSSLRSDTFLVHKASFIVWVGAVGIHILGHLPEMLRFLRLSNDSRRELMAARSPRSAQPALTVGDRLPGGTGRWLSIASAIVLGLVLAAALIPDFASWTGAAGAAVIHHHHHHLHG
jgi:type IV secretory pathway TrbD component